MKKLLELHDVSVKFPIKGGIFGRVKDHFVAVNKVSFDVYENETFGLVGESGSGKSTLSRAILQLIPNVEGEILFEGRNINGLPKSKWKSLRREIQIVFQDPYAAMNPRQKVGDALVEVISIHRIRDTYNEALKYAKELLDMVGLNPDNIIDSYPSQLSGGMRQRIGIAKALSLNPKFIILDEPTSFLDISVQARLLTLLKEIQEELKLTYLFISHDLNVVGYMSDRIGVMKNGNLVELADTETIFSQPKEEYTKLLLSSILTTNPREREEKIG